MVQNSGDGEASKFRPLYTHTLSTLILSRSLFVSISIFVSNTLKMGWKIQKLLGPLHGLRKMTWVQLDSWSEITLPANGTVKNGSFIFCPTTDAVPWWQAMEFQIFVVVLETPPLVSPENAWLGFQICKKKKKLDLANCKGLSWVGKLGGENPQPSQETSSKATSIYANTWFSMGGFSVGVFKWSRHLKGENTIHKWDHRWGES